MGDVKISVLPSMVRCNLVPRALNDSFLLRGRKREDPGNEVG